MVQTARRLRRWSRFEKDAGPACFCIAFLGTRSLQVMFGTSDGIVDEWFDVRLTALKIGNFPGEIRPIFTTESPGIACRLS